MKKVHFPGLNGLRFLAAFGVVLHHIEQAKLQYGLPNLWLNLGVQHLGGHCVAFFFVLSGFLITYLLLEEAENCGDISVPQFYVRRILRIWPLYFVITAIGFFLLPAFPAYNVPGYPLVRDGIFWQKLGYYLALSPQLQSAVYPLAFIPYAGVLWSVGVEEWFYAAWPWLVKYGQKFLVPILVGIVVLFYGLREVHFATLVNPSTQDQIPVDADSMKLTLHNMLRALDLLIGTLWFDCMAMGGLFAVLLRRARGGSAKAMKYLNIFYRKEVQIGVGLVLVIGLVTGRTFGTPGQFIYSLLFATLILNVASNPRCLVSFEHPVLRWLGEISYGLYCYNWIAAASIVLLVKAWFGPMSMLKTDLVVFPGGIALTVLFATLSYYLIERPFLRLKRRRYSRVVTLPETAA